MTNIDNKNLWFRAKKYGWGWYPSTWQGALITLAYCAGIAVIAIRAVRITENTTNNASTFLWNYLPPLFILSVIMIWICYRTGEKPRWRWGS